MGGGSGAEPQQLEAARRRRKFKDRLGHPANSKHFKAQIFTYVKLLIHIILHICIIIHNHHTVYPEGDWGNKFCKSAIFKQLLKRYRGGAHLDIKYNIC